MPDPNPHLSERARKAQRIIAHPQNYKVCEGCDSIVGGHVATCPNCSSYRFDESATVVVLQAKLLASREQTSVVADDLM
jgi:RNA polymerase subunit RPABC4/transcription elongation factor Spt4